MEFLFSGHLFDLSNFLAPAIVYYLAHINVRDALTEISTRWKEEGWCDESFVQCGIR
jgi:hypothetical protein